MISRETKIAVLKALGKGHISKIASYALEKQVVKENGEPYSNSMISAVLRGQRENRELEDAILSCADQHLVDQEEKQQRMKALVKKVKAVH